MIRVFSIPMGEKLLEFRRGMKRFIQINSLSFSTDDMYLVSSSSTETVHIFRLVDPPQEKYATTSLLFYKNADVGIIVGWLKSIKAG